MPLRKLESASSASTPIDEASTPFWILAESVVLEEKELNLG